MTNSVPQTPSHAPLVRLKKCYWCEESTIAFGWNGIEGGGQRCRCTECARDEVYTKDDKIYGFEILSVVDVSQEHLPHESFAPKTVFKQPQYGTATSALTERESTITLDLLINGKAVYNKITDKKFGPYGRHTVGRITTKNFKLISDNDIPGFSEGGANFFEILIIDSANVTIKSRKVFIDHFKEVKSVWFSSLKTFIGDTNVIRSGISFYNVPSETLKNILVSYGANAAKVHLRSDP